MVTPESGHWNVITRALPYVTVCIIPFDKTRKFPIIWRTENVRSAKNQWSLPTGLHEPGFTLGEQACNELNEELGLTGNPDTWRFLTTYENILPKDNYHWVISMGTIAVRSLGELTNKEPDKHGEIRLIDPFMPGVDDYVMALCMGAPMRTALVKMMPSIRRSMDELFPQ